MKGRGQLLAVRDAKGAAVEEYLYDAAGNVLRKTVEGKTTCFEYDGANQLVKAVLPDGSVRDYAYDAAGRMTKDGDKTYSYGWLNKVMSISENGQTASTFDYTIEGQLSKKTSNGAEETFLWDDLALIGRNGSEFTVEPYVTGGNPVMADNKVLFNDMLGTTLGAVTGGKFEQIQRDAFGQVLSNPLGESLNFFTGKPQIGGLGYAFLFRNYDSQLGKWTAQDPLGYPDGWNNLAYCGNKTVKSIDQLGCETLEYYGPTKVYVDRDNVTYDIIPDGSPYNTGRIEINLATGKGSYVWAQDWTVTPKYSKYERTPVYDAYWKQITAPLNPVVSTIVSSLVGLSTEGMGWGTIIIVRSALGVDIYYMLDHLNTPSRYIRGRDLGTEDGAKSSRTTYFTVPIGE